MKLLCQALISSFALTSLTAAAATPTDPVKAITAATSWDDVIKQVDTRFPKLITDELRAATKDVAFPTIRSYRGQLVVTDSSGARMTLAFGKDGTASVNGKKLSIRPLATVGAEVKRISSGELKGAALIDYLIPDARAAGLGAAGASLAFAASNSWKADACAENELSDELTQTCPLMGVGMVQLASAKEATEKSKKPYKPVGLKCPDTNGGSLEIIKRNEDNLTVRNSYKYKDGVVIHLKIEAAEPKGKFELLRSIDVGSPADDFERDLLSGGINAVKPVYEKVCNGPLENKSRYAAILDSNRRQLGGKSKAETESQPSSMDVN